jgi:hypothetical protein
MSLRPEANPRKHVDMPACSDASPLLTSPPDPCNVTFCQ